MIYSFAINMYAWAVRTASLFHKKARLMVKGQARTFGILKERIVPGTPYVWFHAASLGEFEQGRMLIEVIRRQYPQYKIVLTFFSPSGYEVRKNYEGADIVCYLPFDTLGNARRFVNMVRPRIAFFIKYEFWKNYLSQLRRNGVPVYSVASIFRPNQIFFKPYGHFYSKVLDSLTHFFVQNELSRELLERKGYTNVITVGDTRFDRVLEIRQNAPEVSLASAFARNGQKEDGYVLVAGSTWPPDEDILIDYFNKHREQRLIIAPHVVSEPHLKEIESKLQRPSVRLTSTTAEDAATADCLIVDCYGVLSSIYRYGKIAYVGGGFGVGIHNVPEAAVYGIPVVIGPNNMKFREVQALKEREAVFEIRSSKEYEDILDRLHADRVFCEKAGKAASEYIQQGAGAVGKIMKCLEDTLRNNL